MATVIFDGTKNDLSVGANYSTGALPLADDTLVIGEGGAVINAGITALATINLTGFEVSPQFFGSLGSSAGAVEIQANGSGRYVKINSPGAEFYITAATGITLLQSASTVVGSVYLVGGTTAAVVLQSGTFEAGASAVVTALHNLSANATVRDNATAITTMNALGGSTNSYRAITTANVYGAARLAVFDDEAVTTINVGGVGTYNHQSSGTITTLNLFSGTFTPQNNRSGFTLTTANVYASPTTNFFTKWGGVSFTPGTLNTFGDVEQKVGGSSSFGGAGVGGGR